MRKGSTVVKVSLVALWLGAAARAEDPPPNVPPEAKPAQPDLADAIDTVKSAPLPGEIVVSASRGVPLTYAGGRDVIEPDTLERYPDGSMSTVLRRVPSVVVLPENGNDSRASFGLRGNDPRRSGLITLLIDGVPACEAPYGNTDVDGLPISFERIWRIDVIRGGASVRWGPNSAGGVINFLTEPIPACPTTRVAARFGSDHEWSLLTSAGGTWDRFGALVTLVDKGGDGFRDNSEYEGEDASLKMRYALNDQDSLSVSVSRFLELDAEQPGGLPQAAYDEDPEQSLRKGADFRLETTTYKVDFVHEIERDSSFQLIGWWFEGQRGLFDFRPIAPPFTVSRQQHSDFRAAALEARYAWTTRIFGLKNTWFHSARYLIEKNRELYDRFPLSGGPAQRPFDLDAIFTGNAFSLFNEDTVALTDTVDLALGCRIDDIDMASRSRDTTQPLVERSRHFSEFLPESSLTWRFVENAAVYGSWQRNFLTPQYDTGFDPTSAAFRPVDPEHSETREVGTRVRALPGLEFAAAWFRTEFDDKIDFVNLPNGSKIAVNTGRAESRGVELSAHYEFARLAQTLRGLSAYGTLTRQRSKIKSGVFDGNDTPHSPRRLASWGVQYEHDTGLWGRVGGSHTGKQFKDPDNFTTGSADGIQGPEPAYTLWDAAIGWHQNPDGTGVSVTVGVTNLFEEEYYRRFVSGIYPGAPRQLYAAVGYTLTW
jgi:Fe(3+) dicitrate transport protein